MTETTADNRPEPLDNQPLSTEPQDTEPLDTEPLDTDRIDPLDRITGELDRLGGLDPADTVAVLADVTAELNKELDADTDRS